MVFQTLVFEQRAVEPEVCSPELFPLVLGFARWFLLWLCHRTQEEAGWGRVAIV